MIIRQVNNSVESVVGYPSLITNDTLVQAAERILSDLQLYSLNNYLIRCNNVLLSVNLEQNERIGKKSLVRELERSTI